MSLPPNEEPTDFPFDNTAMMNIAKYFESIDDFINFMKTCKRSRELTELFKYNPIQFRGRRVNMNPEAIRRIFPNIETFHVEPYCSISCIQHYVTHGKVKRVKFMEETHLIDRKELRRLIDESIDDYNENHDDKVDHNIEFQGRYFCDLTNDILNELAIHDANNRIIRIDNIQLQDTVQRLDLEHVEIAKLGGLSRLMKLEEVVLPSKLRDLEKNCFSGCTSLSSIKFPSTLMNIGPACFWACISLEEIRIPYRVQGFEMSVFAECTRLSRVEIPNITNHYFSFDHSCFCDCRSLQEIMIPPATRYLGNTAFANCTSLSSVTIKNGVRDIYNNCFENCIRLSSIDIPSSVTFMGYRCFYGCTNLENIRFIDAGDQDARISFDGECFRNCRSLRHVSRPPPIIKLEPGLFTGCPLILDDTLNMFADAVQELQEEEEETQESE